jgi:hypothetical protein
MSPPHELITMVSQSKAVVLVQIRSCISFKVICTGYISEVVILLLVEMLLKHKMLLLPVEMSFKAQDAHCASGDVLQRQGA